MLRHPAWAVSSYSSGPTAAGTVKTKSAEVFTVLPRRPVFSGQYEPEDGFVEGRGEARLG